MSTATSIDIIQTDHARPKITQYPTDIEVASKSFARGDKAVLQVIDAPYNGSKPQLHAVFTFDDDVAEGMKGLPPHAPKTARILDVTVHSDFVVTGLRETKGSQTTRAARDNLIKYLQDTYTEPFEERRIFRWLSDPLLVNDIGSISAQWSQQIGGSNANLYRLVNRTTLQQHPLDFDVHPRDSYLTCVQDASERLIVIIVNDVWSKQTFRTNKSGDGHIAFKNPRCTPGILAGTSWTSMSDGTLETFAKLLVLDFFLTSIYLQPVDYYGPLIYPQLSKKEVVQFSLTKNPHLQVPLGLFEPRLSAKSREAFKEIEDAEGILRSVNNLVDSICFVVDAIKQNSGTLARGPKHEAFERCLHELSSLHSERGKNAERALQALSRQLDYLSKRHAIREAKAIRILTILASLYLPLSLSATLLGMQSPFKALAHNRSAEAQNLIGTNLLFDFLGVFIGLATVTIFIVHGIRLGMWFRSNGLSRFSKNSRVAFSIFNYGTHWRYGGLGGQIFDMIRVITKWWIGAGFIITLLVIFLVGMLRTAQNAWDTARVLFATYIVIGGSLMGGCFAMYWLLYRKRLRVR